MSLKRLLLFSFLFSSIVIFSTGCQIRKTDSLKGMYESTNSVDELYPGQYYVWHDKKKKKIEKDLKYDKEKFKSYDYDIFKPVYLDGYSFDASDFSTVGEKTRIAWFDSSSDDKIPTLYKGDELIYYSPDSMPETFNIERFEDYGYSTGIFGLDTTADGKVVYRFENEEFLSSGTKASSTGSCIEKLNSVSETAIIDTIGGKKIDSSYISDAGTLLKMKKDDSYDSVVYGGTKRYTCTLTADTRIFVSMEGFQTVDAVLLKGNVAKIKLPDYMKDGYYCINGMGIFRYVNGTSYDKNTIFNDPIILKDENGGILYDPTELEDEEYQRGNVEKDSFSHSKEITKNVSLDDNVAVDISLNYSENISNDSNAYNTVPYVRYYLNTKDKSIAEGTITNPYSVVGENGKTITQNVKLSSGKWIIKIYNAEYWNNVSFTITDRKTEKTVFQYKNKN